LTSEDEQQPEEEVKFRSLGHTVSHRINDELRSSYINYAMSVIIGRALPDARDGLKPVHRRVLYGMHEGGHTSDKKFSKSARSVGEVMGKYHPHGDQSIYDTMVRMAQEFSLRYPLIEGQGNFGSIDGDPPAAMRYTESRLDRISKHMLEDIDKNTVNFEPNFDDSEQEPTVLPSRLPNLLLNGSDGIAVGMATRIPPHNLTEVAGAIELHVQQILEQNVSPGSLPSISIEQYMEHVKGPDFPTGATIFGIDGISDMYQTGKGRFHVRAKCDVFEDNEGKRIIITEIPYQVKKSDMLEHIAELVNKETIVGIRDIRDESSKEGIRVVIEVKNNADPHAVLNQLYKSSRLQESYSANMMAILDGRPVLMTLPVMLQTYVAHREQVIERRAHFDLDKAEARAHILEGLVRAQDRIDDVIEAGKRSESREQFEAVLSGKELMSPIAAFDFSEAQAKAIAERRLYQLSRLDVNKVINEHNELKLTIADLKEIIESRPRRLKILTTELSEVVERHGDQRRSEINEMPLSMDREDLIQERAIVITLSEDNYIRHTPVESFRIQNRGGKGLKGVATKEEDSPQAIVTCFSKDRLLIFTSKGRVYGLKAWETPLGSRLSRGTHIRNLLEELQEDEDIITILPLPRELVDDVTERCLNGNSGEKRPPSGHYLMFATKLGLIKKTDLHEYVRINKNGKYALRFKIEGDELVNVRRSTDEHDIVMISSTGYASRFKCAAIRPSGRVSGGVYGIKVGDRKGSGGGEVIGMVSIIDPSTQILTISKYGMAKRSRLGTALRIPDVDAQGEQRYDEDGTPKMITDGYRSTRPGAKGVRTMKLDEEFNDSIVSVRIIPNPDDQLFILTKKGMLIRIRTSQTKETTGKATRGTRVMELRNDSKTGFDDEIIFTSRLPAELIDDEIKANANESSEEE
jgi:DNA gyrase subunit A